MPTAGQLAIPFDDPVQPGRPAPPATDLTREYAAAGFRSNVAGPQVLGVFDDEIRAALGPAVYDEAANDPVIESAVEDLVMSANGDDPLFTPAFPEGHPRRDEAVQAVDFCRELWAGIENDPQETLEQVTRAACYNGNGVVEQTFEPVRGRGAIKYRVKYWKALERDSTAYVVDEHMNTLGLLMTKPGRSVTVGGLLYSDVDLVRREKFTILTLRGRGNDPRGRSLVASAMTARGIKRQVILDWVCFLARKSELVPYGIAAENAPPEVPIDPATGLPDESATPISGPEALAQKLAMLDTRKAIGLAFGSLIGTLDLQGDSQLYLTALDWLDSQMTRGILLQTLATTDAKHGTRAQAAVHENVKDLLTFWLKQKEGRTIRRDLFRTGMLVNFGEDAARDLTPLVTLGDFDRKDWSEQSNSAAALLPVLNQFGYTAAQDEIVTSIGLSADREEPVPVPGDTVPPGVQPPALAAASAAGAGA